MNIIFDMGGVLMTHNMPGCIAAFSRLMGEENMHRVLGLCVNGEGESDSLMDLFECGQVTEDEFVSTILRACRPGTTVDDVIAAWNLMHGGIPQERLDTVRALHDAGHHILLLSNSNAIHRRDILEHYDMSMFDVLIFSHLEHARKPDRPLYDAVMRCLRERGWDTLPTIFIDDIAVNREVGETYGWRTYPDIEALPDLCHNPSK